MLSERERAKGGRERDASCERKRKGRKNSSFFLFPKKKKKKKHQGISDVVASSYGGRNARVAREYALRVSSGRMPPGRATVDALEAELLAGQSLQGELTSRECSEAIELRWGPAEGARRFPLFSTVRAVFDGVLPPEAVLRYRAAAAELVREAELGASKEEEEEGRRQRRQQRASKREPAGV